MYVPKWVTHSGRGIVTIRSWVYDKHHFLVLSDTRAQNSSQHSGPYELIRVGL